MPYLGRGPGFGIRQKYFYTASADDTSVSGSDDNNLVLTFTDGLFIDVYLNGVLLDPNSDYNTTTANTVAGLAALSADDFVEIVAYDSFSIGDVVPASSGGTFSGAITSNGDITATGTLLAQGDTAAGDDAAIGYTAAEGLILTGQGTTNDVTIKNDADTAVIQIPTGGTATTFTGDITIGNASAADRKIVFDGNAQDFYVGLDDSADDLVIGLGSAVGTTPAISINENLVSTFGATTVGKLFTDATNTGDITLDFTAHQNFLLTFTGDVELQNPTTENVGQSGFIVIIQDGTGSRLLSFEGDFETAGAAGITLSTAANSVDVIPYIVIAANRILLGAVQLAFS
jgi:hypothetical protein